MKKTNQQLIKESIADAKAITAAAEKRTARLFLKEFSAPVKSMLSDLINEQTSTGSDQPGGYNQNADQDAVEGTDINDGTGKGPDNLQENDLDIPSDDENPELEVTEEFGEPEVGGEEEFGEPEVDENSNLDFSETGEEEMYEMGEEDPTLNTEEPSGEEDQVIEIVDDTNGEESNEEPVFEKKNKDEDEDDKVNENKYKKAYARLVKQHKIVLNDVKKLREGFVKLNLFNAKLANAFQLMRTPGLTRSEKKYIAETFDRAKSIREVNLITETLKRTVISNVAKTNRNNPVVNKNVKSVTSEKTKLNEAVNSRMQILAFGDEDDK